ncbi:MAG: hypothetical protein L0Y38_10650 [Methylococcaceae bacterium]|nr:hypothetical protein [Methylococcaceae bacterium]
MNRSDIQDYWRWKLVRQVSYFINDPGDQNTEALLDMIEVYPKVNQSLAVPGNRVRIEPAAADFVCTMDM